jgi:hypothetical protein
MRALFIVVALFGLATAGCGAGRTALPIGDAGPRSTVCTSDPPVCVTTGEDPCGAPKNVGPSCDEPTKTWSCPSGSITRAPNPTGVCRPFHDGTLTALSGSLVRLPTEDGRCYWFADSATKKGGATLRGVAFDVTEDALVGACPQKPGIVGEIVQLDEPDPSKYQVQVLGGLRFAGQVRVLYRLFRVDPNGPFGLTELGGGFAHWDAKGATLVVPSVAKLRWGPDLSLGDAALVQGDHLFAWGCPPPVEFLTEKCLVARFDATEQMELYQGNGVWSKSTAASSAVRQFDQGPWLGAVTRNGTGFLHVYGVGFGSELEAHAAATLEGTWTKTANLRHCDLPTTDGKAYCAGPVVHEEMASPAAPKGLVVTYAVGTTAPNAAELQATRPDDYWPRLVWVQAP